VTEKGESKDKIQVPFARIDALADELQAVLERDPACFAALWLVVGEWIVANRVNPEKEKQLLALAVLKTCLEKAK
jgi:hypothetical protein